MAVPFQPNSRPFTFPSLVSNPSTAAGANLSLQGGDFGEDGKIAELLAAKVQRRNCRLLVSSFHTSKGHNIFPSPVANMKIHRIVPIFDTISV